MLVPFFASIVAAVVAPPSYTPAPPPVPGHPGEQPVVRTMPIDVVIRGPEGVLWQGTLRVSDRSDNRTESRFTQSRSEPSADGCSLRGYYQNGEQESLTVALSIASQDGDLVSLNARWVRPNPKSCDGLRTVEMRESVKLEPGQTKVVTGDAGLQIELRRR